MSAIPTYPDYEGFRSITGDAETSDTATADTKTVDEPAELDTRMLTDPGQAFTVEYDESQLQARIHETRELCREIIEIWREHRSHKRPYHADAEFMQRIFDYGIPYDPDRQDHVPAGMAWITAPTGEKWFAWPRKGHTIYEPDKPQEKYYGEMISRMLAKGCGPRNPASANCRRYGYIVNGLDRFAMRASDEVREIMYASLKKDTDVITVAAVELQDNSSRLLLLHVSEDASVSYAVLSPK